MPGKGSATAHVLQLLWCVRRRPNGEVQSIDVLSSGGRDSRALIVAITDQTSVGTHPCAPICN